MTKMRCKVIDDLVDVIVLLGLFGAVIMVTVILTLMSTSFRPRNPYEETYEEYGDSDIETAESRKMTEFHQKGAKMLFNENGTVSIQKPDTLRDSGYGVPSPRFDPE